jgi:hypothetical protein
VVAARVRAVVDWLAARAEAVDESLLHGGEDQAVGRALAD